MSAASGPPNIQATKMQRLLIACFAIATFLAPAAPARAQDPLEPLMKQDKLTRGQRATMEAELSLRANRLRDAGTNAQLRTEARDRILKTAATSGATQGSLDAYAEICAGELSGITGAELLETAMEAVMILSQLNNAQTVDALAAGLRSRHAAVRLMSARSIQRLHDLIKDDQKKCSAVLRALGRAGAREPDEHVLRVTYQAVDFKSSVRNFKFADLSAKALTEIFQGRLEQLDGGSRDEMRDEYGIEAAARCYADGSRDDKAKLIGSLARFMEHTLARYFDPDMAAESLTAVVRYIGRIEDVLHEMAKASNVTLSCERLKLNPRSADKQDQDAASRAAIECIFTALRGEPWKIR